MAVVSLISDIRRAPYCLRSSQFLRLKGPSELWNCKDIKGKFLAIHRQTSKCCVCFRLSRRPSLYESVHLKGDKMQLHMRVQIIRQIAQAMGYLHAKGIILRRLNTKNIFLEPKVKISIMDHGMSQQKCDR